MKGDYWIHLMEGRHKPVKTGGVAVAKKTKVRTPREPTIVKVGNVKLEGNIPEELVNFALKHTDAIHSVANEGKKGYWIYLRSGWIDNKNQTHQIDGATVQSLIDRWQFVKKER